MKIDRTFFQRVPKNHSIPPEKKERSSSKTKKEKSNSNSKKKPSSEQNDPDHEIDFYA